jgi:hypothetical protein
MPPGWLVLLTILIRVGAGLCRHAHDRVAADQHPCRRLLQAHLLRRGVPVESHLGAVGLDVFVPPPSGCAVCLQFGVIVGIWSRSSSGVRSVFSAISRTALRR